MGYYLAIPILALLAALQSSIIPHLRIYSGQPDLILLFVLAWAVHASLEEGIFWAVVGSIFSDLLSIVPVGTSAIAPILSIFIIDFIRRNLFHVNLLFVGALVIFSTVLQQIVVWIILAVNGYGISINESIQYVLLPSIAMNAILALPVYLIVRIIQRRSTRRRSVFSS